MFVPNSRRVRRRRARRAPTRALGRMRYRRRRQYIPRTITPDSKMVKLRYSEVFQLNPGSGATAMAHIKANDIYAPSTGSGAHQPLGFDQIMQLYERFCVVGSKISCAFQLNQDGTNTGIVGVALRNTDTDESVQDTTAVQTNEGLLERNRTKWTYSGNQLTGAPVARVQQKFGTKKFFHVSTINSNAGNQRDEGTLWGTASASPTTLAYYNIFCAAFDDRNTNINCTVRIVVEYTAVFQGRVLLGQS
jgi:hypothetical protein